MRRVFIVDDDRRTRRVLQIVVERLGLESIALESPHEALALLREESASLVLTDLKMPDMDGLSFMRELRTLDEDVPVIMLTAFGTVETAVEAMKLGALDYVSKPFDVDPLELLIRRALELAQFKREHRYLRQAAEATPTFEDMVGQSPPMHAVFDLIRKVAPTNRAVMITGESGTGKELVARAIHRLSERRKRLFVPLNCAAIPGDLLESELFGHVKGAFSGAQSDRMGRFQTADGGTVFLDEIGDMEYRLQAKLLRVLEEGVVESVGSDRRTAVDVRVVASTNANLESAIQEGRFREDLFYRLAVFHIELPPLRERKEDIAPLAESLLRRSASELGKRALELTPRASRLLEQYPWPGNVRELRNIMERAAVLADGAEIDDTLIGRLIPCAGPEEEEAELDLSRAVADVERRMILRALASTGDNKAQAASLLGIGERTLWTKLKKYGL